MKNIAKFAEKTERIYASTADVGTLQELFVDIDVENDEILMSRWEKGGDCIFNLEMNMGHATDLEVQTKYMRTIEMFYPQIFRWRYNGKNIEAIARIPMKRENLGVFGRYRGIFNFIRKLRKQLTNVLKYRDFLGVSTTHVIEKEIYVTGSINNDTTLFVVPIKPGDDIQTILKKSNERIIDDVELVDLNMKFWVKEINPDYYKAIKAISAKKYPLTDDVWEKYPICIKKICGLKKKGNYLRFILATFFLHVHNERDAKHQLFSVLSDEERGHMDKGNCKDQWRAILAKDYSPPSFKTMIDLGYATGPQDCIGLHITEEEGEEE